MLQQIRYLYFDWTMPIFGHVYYRVNSIVKQRYEPNDTKFAPAWVCRSNIMLILPGYSQKENWDKSTPIPQRNPLILILWGYMINFREISGCLPNFLLYRVLWFMYTNKDVLYLEWFPKKLVKFIMTKGYFLLFFHTKSVERNRIASKIV